MPKRLPPNSFRIYHSDTVAGRDLYPGQVNARNERVQTATWKLRTVSGPTSADGDELIDTWAQDDYSAGFGIKDANETTDTARITFGLIDGRHPKSMCLPPETTTPTKPAWATGSAWPIGDVGTQFYVGWSNGIAGWKPSTSLFSVTQNAWPASFVPLGEAVPFCGKLFVPGGAQGFVALSELTPATQTLTVAQLNTLNALCFGLWDSKLFAIDTNNSLWQLTVAGAAAGATTLANWTQIKDGLSNVLYLDTGLTPTALVTYWNAAGAEVLWCITRAGGAYLFDFGGVRWIKSTIREAVHPDWGYAAEVFRDGEDLWIAGGGLDVTRFTSAQVEVPLSGPSKDQGVPAAYQGSIVDLCSERSTLYAFVQAGTSLAAGSPTTTWTLLATYGTQGGNTTPVQFNSPNQVAVDSSGFVYVADTTNNRVLKLSSSGIYVSAITGITSPYGVAVDASGNIYVTYGAILRKYNSALVTQWSTTFGTALAHVATDGTNVYVVSANDVVYKRLCSTGAAVANWGSLGTGNGQFTTPYGIALINNEVYVADTGNNRVQVFTTAGVYARQWGSAGSSNGLFSSPFGIAGDAANKVWVADRGNNRLQRFTGPGVYETQIAQSTPQGLGIATGDVLWVSSQQHNLAKWDETTVTTTALPSKCWMGGWSGTAWNMLWESTNSVTPTWMRVAIKGDYALWWGDTSGNIYRQLLPPPFFNPASRVLLSAFPFAATGWMETVRYDANMSGWDKIASHAFAMLDYASPSTYVDISFRTDADQFNAGVLDPPYRKWKRVDHIGRTLMWFDDTTTDPNSGLPWHSGEPFQWIQFYFAFTRGSDRYKSPLWTWHSMHHVTVPQDSASFKLTIPLNFDRTVYRRDPDEMAQTLFALQRRRGMIWLQLSNPRPGNPERQVFFRGRVTQVKSEFWAGADNNLVEVIVLSFIELGASDNLHTTIATDTP